MRYPASRLLFLLSVLWGASIFWIAPRPPMVDFPQHAGQVALLHDLATGSSPWASLFQINLFTPYLVGYGLALPFSFFLPVAAAIKLVFSAAYVAFVFALVALRRHFKADPRLDWFFLLSFFGISYYWGFYTFLTAAPIAVAFILVADRYALEPTFKRGLATTLLGIVLLASHGLMFVFGFAVAGILYTVRCCAARPWAGRWLRHLWPFVIAGLACLVYFLVSTRLQAQYGGIGNAGPVIWNWSWKRLVKIFIDSLGGKTDIPLLVTACVLPLIPWMLGLRINTKRPATWAMFAFTLLIALTLPVFAMATGLLYIRFALFTLPAYALMFTLSRPSTAQQAVAGNTSAPAPIGERIAVPLMIAVTWLMLGQHSLHAWRFAREARDFEAVLAPMQPAQRALSLPFAQRSEAANNDFAYLHYGTWYQSEKQGLVDFNFAWLPPQIARFRPDRLPAVTYGFEHSSHEFDWKKHHGENYRYFLVRHSEPLSPDLFKGADCAPAQVLASGAWTLLERRDCPAVSAQK
jgi:MFS family permease